VLLILLVKKYFAQLLDILWQADIGILLYPIKPDFFNDLKMVLNWTKTIFKERFFTQKFDESTQKVAFFRKSAFM
jgi:hypothetical protein